MSLPVAPDHARLVVRADEAEQLSAGSALGTLLLDGDMTGHALNAVRMQLAVGADGAKPHRHGQASELFYVLDGEVEVLSGDEVVTLGAHDVALVPAGTDHAFAASRRSTADLLIVMTPGTERFGYFRLLERVGRGEATVQELLASQETYDNHFVASSVWDGRAAHA